MFRNTFPGEVLVHKQGWFNGLTTETRQGFGEFYKVSCQGEVWTECLYQWVRTPQTDIYDFDVAQAFVLIWNLLFFFCYQIMIIFSLNLKTFLGEKRVLKMNKSPASPSAACLLIVQNTLTLQRQWVGLGKYRWDQNDYSLMKFHIFVQILAKNAQITGGQ